MHHQISQFFPPRESDDSYAVQRHKYVRRLLRNAGEKIAVWDTLLSDRARAVYRAGQAAGADAVSAPTAAGAIAASALLSVCAAVIDGGSLNAALLANAAASATPLDDTAAFPVDAVETRRATTAAIACVGNRTAVRYITIGRWLCIALCRHERVIRCSRIPAVRGSFARPIVPAVIDSAGAVMLSCPIRLLRISWNNHGDIAKGDRAGIQCSCPAARGRIRSERRQIGRACAPKRAADKRQSWLPKTPPNLKPFQQLSPHVTNLQGMPLPGRKRSDQPAPQRLVFR
jgi:hypothetical protein